MKLLLTTALLASLTTSIAYACPTPDADHCDPKKHGKMEPMSSPWQKLHDELKLTPEQEASWKAMQDHNRARMEQHHKDMQEAIEQDKNLTAPQRMERRNAMMEHHQQERTEMTTEFKAFYEKLSPEQQKTLNSHSGRHEGMHEGCDPKRLPPNKK